MRAIKTVRAIANGCQKLLAKGWKVRIRKVDNESRIRFRPPNYQTYCDCPITALHRDRFHPPQPELSSDDYERAARKLSIPASFRDIVVEVADYRLDICHSEEVETARLLFLEKWDLPLDSFSSAGLAGVPEASRKLLQAEKARWKKERHLQLQP